MIREANELRKSFLLALWAVSIWACVGSAPSFAEDDTTIHYSDGLIVQADGGGGDTAQREGWYWLGVIIRNKLNLPGVPPWTVARDHDFEWVLNKLEPHHDGVFYRNPTQPNFSNPYDPESGTSRDQLVPLIAAMALDGHQQGRLLRLWNALPTDLTGKHAFNGSSLNERINTAWDCRAVKNLRCSADMACNIGGEEQSCKLQTDAADCGLGPEALVCHHDPDTRNCDTEVTLVPGVGPIPSGLIPRGLPKPKTVTVHDGDLVCVGERAAQNRIYSQNEAACLIKQNGMRAFEPQRAACLARRAANNKLFQTKFEACRAINAFALNGVSALKGACETARSAQSVACDSNVPGACAATRSAQTSTCNVFRAGAIASCQATALYSGDLFGPQYVNLFLRALVADPRAAGFRSPFALPWDFAGFELGERELDASVMARVTASEGNRNDTGPDLNLIVALILAEQRWPTATSKVALEHFKSRYHSYGSFLNQFHKQYGQVDEARNLMDDGINHGWMPETGSIFGGVKWYHRPTHSGNPGLVALYEPIIAYYFRQTTSSLEAFPKRAPQPAPQPTAQPQPKTTSDAATQVREHMDRNQQSK